MDLLTLDQNSIRKTVTSSSFTKKPRSTKNKDTKHFFLFRNEGRPSSTFSQFRQNRQLTSHTKTDVNYTINSNKNIAYFRDILNYSKGLINKYNQDKLDIKLNNTVKTLSSEHNDYPITISPTKATITFINNQSRKNNKISIKKHLEKGISQLNLDDYYNNIEKYETKEHTPLSIENSINNKTNKYEIKTSGKLVTNLVKNLLYKNNFCSYTSNAKKQLNKTQKSFYLSSKENTTKDETDFPKINQLSSRNVSKFYLLNETSPQCLSLDLPKNGTQYSLPQTFRDVKDKLTNEVKLLLSENKNNYKAENSFQSIPKNLTNYANDLIAKIKIVNIFLDKQNKSNFVPKQQRHKIIYVILDGTVIFTKNYIKGFYIEIPSRRYLSFLETKKQRLMKFYEFLNKCEKLFNLHIQLKNIFLANGIPIFDLIDIPEKDRFVFVSSNSLFKGIHLFNGDHITRKEAKIVNEICDKDMQLLHFKPASKERVQKFNFSNFLKKKKKNQNKKNIVKKFKKIIKKKKYLLDQSFTFGITSNEDIEEYKYYSDNENKKNRIKNYLNLSGYNKYETISKLSDYHLHSKINDLMTKRDEKIHKFTSKRPDEKTFEGINKLIKSYNSIRAKKYKINVNHLPLKEQNVEEELRENATTMMKLFIKKMKIFRNYKDTNKELNTVAFYGNFATNPKHKNYVQKNIWNTHNLIYYSDYKTEKYYPDLISFNIPSYLKTFPKLKRREFFEIFVEFKTLLKLCVTINKNIHLVKEGIDFNTFFSCNPQMKSQGQELAMKIFTSINTLNSKYINWAEYMHGLLTIKSRELNDKLDLFLKIIDSDGNGYLSFDEVYSLSIDSLSRSINKPHSNQDDNEVVKTLADYFAKLIFQLVEMPIDKEIPIEMIKQKICEGGKAASYLEMFICADNFT